MKYVVSIAGRSVQVEIADGEIRVGGRVCQAELRGLAGTPVRNLLVDGESWIVPMESLGGGEWMIQRWGERFEAVALDERTHYVRGLVGPAAGNSAGQALKAPMPGLVVRILVEPGQTIQAGAGLVVLEAMKMENELKAAGAGVVEKVQVEPGQAVEKGAVLISFAPAPSRPA